MPRLRRLARRGGGITLLPVNWVFRWGGFGWIGALAFGFYPPHHRVTLVVQAIGYAMTGLAMVAWLLLDVLPRAMRHRARLLPLVLGVIVVAASATAAAGSGGTFLVISAFIATMVVAGDADLPAALAVTAGGILAIEVSGLVFGESYPTLLGLPSVLIAGLMIGRNRAAYRIQAEQSAALLAQRERLEAERNRADLLDERARIAREIHDVLAHSLGALGIQIQAARSVLTDKGDVEQASDLLAAAQRMAAEGLVETRRAVNALRTGTLPLDEELAKAATMYAQRYHVEVSMRTGGTPRPVPPDVTVALLRVAQEALVNAAKHAPGQPVTACLAYDPGEIRLTVRNNLRPPAGTGAGSPGASTAEVRTADTGYGLTSMRERVRLLQGTLDAGPRQDTWTVIARLPLGDPRTAGPATTRPAGTARARPDPETMA